MARDLLAVLQQTHVEPALLVVEIPERVFLGHPDRTLQELKTVRDLGLTIALDDFGADYSGLCAIKQLPIDWVKLDCALIRHLGTDPMEEAIIETVIAMAHRLGLKVVAKGVNTAEQLKFLGQARCDLVQGCLLSRLVGAEALAEMAPPSTDSQDWFRR